MLRKVIKMLHEMGAIGVLGSFATCIVLIAKVPTHSMAQYAAVRQSIAAISQWLLVPSLAVVLVSGLLGIAATDAYKDAGWVWVKALLGISMFEGTLVTVGASARQAAQLSAQAALAPGDATQTAGQLAQVLHTEWGGLWLLLLLSVANIILAVWRPRLWSARRVE
jgi:hypothetical protein